MSKYFTQAEAQAKIGTTIRTRTEWSGVPRGTTGRVIPPDGIGRGKPAATEPSGMAEVEIAWELPPRQFESHSQPLQDWFTKEEYEQFLTEEP